MWETILLCGIFLVISSYYDFKSRGLPPLLGPTFCGVGFAANIILGSEINTTILFILFLCFLYHLAVFAKLYGRDDAWILCAMTLTIPFIITPFGLLIPSIIVIGAGLFTCGILYFLVCIWKNRGHTMEGKNKFGRLIMHVNRGERFVVPAHVEKDGKMRFVLSQRSKKVQKCDSKYVMPLLPLIPIFSVWYLITMIVFLPNS